LDHIPSTCTRPSSRRIHWPQARVAHSATQGPDSREGGWSSCTCMQGQPQAKPQETLRSGSDPAANGRMGHFEVTVPRPFRSANRRGVTESDQARGIRCYFHVPSM
jgi:hypothetical protein